MHLIILRTNTLTSTFWSTTIFMVLLKCMPLFYWAVCNSSKQCLFSLFFILFFIFLFFVLFIVFDDMLKHHNSNWTNYSKLKSDVESTLSHALIISEFLMRMSTCSVCTSTFLLVITYYYFFVFLNFPF